MFSRIESTHGVFWGIYLTMHMSLLCAVCVGAVCGCQAKDCGGLCWDSTSEVCCVFQCSGCLATSAPRLSCLSGRSVYKQCGGGFDWLLVPTAPV